ncbi:hypothetical protein AB870_23675 (plasmid) [Pandoraea faecigallinarum]|uniref:Uncharacterized protein n=1 Tax=Pandoraea faecigallinarum TaxID=656179 RepID=A0A0H3X373_9BURK|nr:hypothetical protein [Pandoraea faecigallinarum]AKM33226.1 hypothetical protein AB870_23675 [Pandoraea faecigallinarum]
MLDNYLKPAGLTATTTTATTGTQGTTDNQAADGDPLRNPPAYFAEMGFASEASQFFPPIASNLMGTGEAFKTVTELPDFFAAMRDEYKYLGFADPCLHYKDIKKRIYNERIFDEKLGENYAEKFCNAMNAADSKEFDIRNFECIKNIYKKFDDDTTLSMPEPVIRVLQMSADDSLNEQDTLVDLATKEIFVKDLEGKSVFFNVKTRQLFIQPENGWEYTGFRFKSDIIELKKKEFIDALKGAKFYFKREQLLELFEGIDDHLPDYNIKLKVSVRHGPGYAELYFPNQKYPDYFAQNSLPHDVGKEGFSYSYKNSEWGMYTLFNTSYKNEEQIKRLFEANLKKFRIAELKNFTPDVQISLIVGFVSEMEHLHICSDDNNRVWIQIILNRLLRECGQKYTILAVPNGFASAVRYFLKDNPKPGTPEYVKALQPAIDAVEDGKKYYKSTCP